jgi:outer membrane immunogenic protein
MNFRACAKIAGSMLATTAFVAISSVAFANGQGTPVEPPPPAPMPAPAPAPEPAPVMESAPLMPWQGGYIGVFAGYGWGNNDDDSLKFDTNLDHKYNDTVLDSANHNIFGSGFGSKTDGGFDGGIRAGYDWQSGNFVYGALIEADFPDVTDHVTGVTTATDAGGSNAYELSRDLNWMGAARLRAGAVLGDSWLLYATGGVAYGDIDHSFRTTNDVNAFHVDDKNDAWGWQAGAGLETMISPHFTLGVEYLYTSLDDSDSKVEVGPGTGTATNPWILDNAAGTDFKRDEDRFNIQSVRATATYRFGE